MVKNKKVILIMTDTQRTDMLGCYGNQAMHTPNLDQLAAQGMRFEKAYTTQPVCQPARAGIFTGMYPNASGSWTNSVGIGDNVHTIGERLKDKGIHTAYIGKWHLDGSDYFGLGRCPKGWDETYWYDMRNYLEELTEDERVWSRTSRMMEEKGVEAAFTYAHRCSNRAIDFLEKHHEEDFFLVVSYDEPHGPSLAPEPYASMYKDYIWKGNDNLKDSMENKPEHQKIWASKFKKASYNQKKTSYLLGCNAYVDQEIGRVLEAVEQYAEDATIIYTSDHGVFLGAHGLEEKGPAMYDEITKVPFIIKSHGQVSAGVNPHPVSHVDIAPTIFDIMAIETPEVFSGKSLVDELGKESKRVNDHVFMEFGRYEVDHDGFGGLQVVRAVTDGRYKLVLNLLTSDELYDLETDKEELHNLIEDERYEVVRNKLHDAILRNMNETRDTFRGYYWERRPWRKDASPASWDYTGCTRQRSDSAYEPRQLDYSTGLEIKELVRKK